MIEQGAHVQEKRICDEKQKSKPTTLPQTVSLLVEEEDLPFEHLLLSPAQPCHCGVFKQSFQSLIHRDLGDASSHQPRAKDG